MCTTCVTTADAAVFHVVGAAAIAGHGLRHVVDRALGRHRTERAAIVHDHNHAFLSELGLDADAVLGPRPVAYAPSAHSST